MTVTGYFYNFATVEVFKMQYTHAREGVLINIYYLRFQAPKRRGNWEQRLSKTLNQEKYIPMTAAVLPL